MKTNTHTKDTILIVDDEPFNIEILSAILENYDLVATTNPNEVETLIETNNVHLILLDIMMPEISGIDLAKRIKSNPDSADIPILFITARDSDQCIENAFSVGASDYITKPFRRNELLARVKTHFNMYKIIQKLKYEANFDYLSGARNRRSFFELGEEVYKNAPPGELFGMIIDIDHFKLINDTYGHAVGDEAIKALANHIKSSIDDETMLFARLGGEEFGILVSHKNSETLLKWVNALRVSISKLPIDAEGKIISMTVSIGVVQNSKDYKTLDHFLNEADQQLYKAKESGRNNVKFRV